MDVPGPIKKTYTYFEYAAAKLYFTDVKLHLATDQADSGFHLQKSEWDTGLSNPIDSLNFHTLWENLEEKSKGLYRELARHELYGTKEITRKESC
jgi:hypothetical protein